MSAVTQDEMRQLRAALWEARARVDRAKKKADREAAIETVRAASENLRQAEANAAENPLPEPKPVVLSPEARLLLQKIRTGWAPTRRTQALRDLYLAGFVTGLDDLKVRLTPAGDSYSGSAT